MDILSAVLLLGGGQYQLGSVLPCTNTTVGWIESPRRIMAESRAFLLEIPRILAVGAAHLRGDRTAQQALGVA